MKRIFFVALALVVMTGVSYAESGNTGIRVIDRDGSSGLELRATDTDVSGLGGDLSEMDSAIVFVQRGTVVVSDDLEDSPEPAGLLQSPTRGVNDYGFYIDIGSSAIGNRIYVPSDYIDNGFFIDSSGFLHGMRNSAFTCYAGNYSVRFPAYGTPQYRLTSGSTMNWTDIQLSYVDSPNVNVLGAHINFWDSRISTIILVIVGGLLVCLFLKR